MSKSIQINEFSVGIGVTTADVITAAGFNGVFGRAGKVTMYAGADAVGLTHALAWDDGVGGEIILQTGSGLSTLSTAGKIKTNEDFVHAFAVPANSKLLWSVTNPTVAAVKINALFVIE